jgi:hypothetical protein
VGRSLVAATAAAAALPLLAALLCHPWPRSWERICAKAGDGYLQSLTGSDTVATGHSNVVSQLRPSRNPAEVGYAHVADGRMLRNANSDDPLDLLLVLCRGRHRREDLGDVH